jgi:DNA-binding MarR family transcriptional regulator
MNHSQNSSASIDPNLAKHRVTGRSMSPRSKTSNRPDLAQNLKTSARTKTAPLGKKISIQLAKSELMESLGFLLKLTHSVVQGRFAEKLEPLGLRPTQFSILKIISENPGLRQQDIGRTLSIQQPNLVVLLASLIEKGWVSRTLDDDDRRAYSLHLTRSGRAILAAADAAHNKCEKEAESTLAPEDAAAFKAALLRLLKDPSGAKSNTL